MSTPVRPSPLVLLCLISLVLAQWPSAFDGDGNGDGYGYGEGGDGFGDGYDDGWSSPFRSWGGGSLGMQPSFAPSLASTLTSRIPSGQPLAPPAEEDFVNANALYSASVDLNRNENHGAHLTHVYRGADGTPRSLDYLLVRRGYPFFIALNLTRVDTTADAGAAAHDALKDFLGFRYCELLRCQNRWVGRLTPHH